MQLNGALDYAGIISQKDRVALNKAHEHLEELSYTKYDKTTECAKKISSTNEFGTSTQKRAWNASGSLTTSSER